MEGESFRVMYEEWFVDYKVDIVLAGHVHAYERSNGYKNLAYNISNGLCTLVSDQSAPVYITIRDGGNRGLVTEMTEPQPSYSAFQEASSGHGIFDIKNRSHAFFSWHRNQDGYMQLKLTLCGEEQILNSMSSELDKTRRFDYFVFLY
ncbi:hypothetical protein ACFX1X_016473 [Malus domestica]